MSVSEHELREIRGLIERRSGMLFDQSRERFFSSRVREHVEAKKLAHGTDLLRLIKNSNVEYDSLLQRLLTQETSFFRYPAIFEVLERKVLPELHMKKFWESPRSLRIWSAGCSTGEEPYSIAMTIADALEFADAWNIHILATDISRNALDHAEHGIYGAREIEALNLRQREQYFSRTNGHFVVKPRIRNMVTFAPMNLAQVVYMGKFDCIFCMNVLMYFSDDRRLAILRRFYDALEPGGYFLLGHAETLTNVPVKFEPVVFGDCRLYRKPGSIAPEPRRAAALVEGAQ